MAVFRFMKHLFGSTAAEISSSLTFLATFTMLLLSLYLLSVLKDKRSKLPPGPRKLPIIGNMNHLLGPHPHRALRDLAVRHGPLMHLQLGRVPTMVVSDARVAKEIMKTHDSIVGSRPMTSGPKVLTYDCTDVAFCPSNSCWRQARKICVLELLSSKRVQSYASIREEQVLEMVRDIFFLSAVPAGGPVNLTKKFFSLTNDITARICFGNKCAQQTEFLEALKAQMELLGGVSLGDYFPLLGGFVDVISGRRRKLQKARHDFDRIFDAIIEEHREKKKEKEEEDLVDVLLRLQRDGNLDVPLTDNNIKAIIWDMFVAGTETSATAMDWAMAELMRNPRLMEKAQKEIRENFGGKSKVEDEEYDEINKLKYLKLVIKEALRLHPPVPLLLPREAMEGFTLQGYEIPAKSTIIVNAWAISRNPNHWENPEVFEPERFYDGLIDFKGKNFEFTPFGSGRRGCPGILFATSVTELALAQLLFYFDWELPNGMKADDLDMTEGYGISVGRKSNLNVIPVPRINIPVPKQN